MTHDLKKRFSLAVVSDAHVHDIEGDYAVPPIASAARLALQTWHLPARSTRVFNESAAAFRQALESIAPMVSAMSCCWGTIPMMASVKRGRPPAAAAPCGAVRHALLRASRQSRHVRPLRPPCLAPLYTRNGASVLVTSDHRDPPAEERRHRRCSAKARQAAMGFADGPYTGYFVAPTTSGGKRPLVRSMRRGPNL